MSDIERHQLDYELADGLAADTPERMKALADPLRLLIVDLVLERAMTVTELAERVERPRGSVAYHVDVLVDAGLLQVVRTRKVRAIEERFYGRTARTFVFDDPSGQLPFVREAIEQFDADRSGLPKSATIRHARIPPERVEEYIARLHEIALEFSSEPRGGDDEFAFMFHVFPTNRLPHRSTPPPEDPAP